MNRIANLSFALLFCVMASPALHAQSLSWRVSYHGGISVPNGGFAKRNLLATGWETGVGFEIQFQLTSQIGFYLGSNISFSKFKKNHFRIPSDCVSDPCATYLTTEDTIRGRDFQYVAIPGGAGLRFRLEKVFDLRMGGGVNVIAGAWMEESGEGKFAKYIANEGVQYFSLVGFIDGGISKSWAITDRIGLFSELSCRYLLHPILEIPTVIDWKSHFKFRPTTFRLGLGIEF